MSLVHIFTQEGKIQDKEIWDRCGKRAARALELAALKLPVVPGFVIESTASRKLDQLNIIDLVREALTEIEMGVGRRLGDEDNPLLLKLICSSSLVLPIYPTVFNVGLSPLTITGLAKLLGSETKAWFEYCFLIRTVAIKLYDIAPEKLDKIQDSCANTLDGQKKCASKMRELVGAENIPHDPMMQLESFIKRAAKRYYDPDLDEEDNVAIMVQGMVFGNLGENGLVGVYHTRDPITGEARIKGMFQRKVYTLDKEKQTCDIHELDTVYLEELQYIAKLLERYFRDMREIKFIVEREKLWLINQTPEEQKSFQAHLRTLIDLHKEARVEDKWLIKQVQPRQLVSLLHPILDTASVRNITDRIKGGLVGSPGVAIGRVYFSADRLMRAHHESLEQDGDRKLILCVTSSFAEDVKAIEVAQGVLSVEGGYSSHAPVVARSMGKIAVINPDIRIDGNKFILGGHTVKEGDYVTLDAPYHDEPTIYMGKGNLVTPDIDQTGVLELLAVAQKYLPPNFVIRANADLDRDAKLAKKMGARGIGLCRTEHMFFADDRIMLLREMILANDIETRKECLSALYDLQLQDFHDLFRVMAPYPVTIRLLDAPLHEFLPRNAETFEKYSSYLLKKGIKPNRKELNERIHRLHEFNPMLGHRGCRVAVTNPEIYEMQVRAILKAALKLAKKGTEVHPEIMIPLVMDVSELNMLCNGKKIEGKTVQGMHELAASIFAAERNTIKYKIGSMIELPAAALLSDKLARYVDFFSYGTNDLTQTTNGLSRDDVNSFFPAYTEYDLLANNPFQVLGTPVQELIHISCSRARLTRPNIKLGLCGEHGAEVDNMEFLKQLGLDYVSCSPYSVPIAILGMAQASLNTA